MMWLLFFYTVPAKLGKLRMRVWRRLIKLGAVSLKGSVYVLPYSEEHREKLHRLTEEVTSLQGEAAFAKVDCIETVTDAEIKALFIAQREAEYSKIEEKADALEIQIGKLQKPVNPEVMETVKWAIQKLINHFIAVKAIDFFNAYKGA